MEFLSTYWMGTSLWFWFAFIAIVIALTAFDLGVLHKDDKEMGIGESLKLSVFYIGIAMIFGGWIWVQKGPAAGMEYYTGYFIEKALSIDNVFVISMIFSFFAVERKYQYRALLWGILAVIVLRGIMIAGGAAMIESAYWVMYLFAAFLIFTGLKMLVTGESEPDVGNNAAVRWISTHMRVTKEHHAEHFFVKVPANPEAPVGARGSRLVWAATPLFLALVVINLADLVFAVDSVPAIFTITRDTFIVYTSNIMAILGLRALYFALAAMVHRFHYLQYALALVLVFIGGKIFVSDFLLSGAKIPPVFSLGVTVALIAGGVIWSLVMTRGEKAKRI
ncbi:TerC family protein [Novosphingobium sp. BW1]|uniref:TerC family protein n=1 Tax=Novosphingobium sp. BW1 TaxID=2592621 RepID=UPI0011DEC9BC|nr:TerC family protein [Novosphingobium sp. BW1]TYC81033.1 TerC family protein [Novosphingobium sp. BW1]